MTRQMMIAGSALLILTAQAALTHKLSRVEYLPTPGPLNENIPVTIGDWGRLQDGVLDPEAYEMLAPDDVLNRTYRHVAGGTDLSLFIGYYRTQLRAKNAHDPKVCLPGAGWNPIVSKQVSVPIAERSEPINVNYYVVAKGGEQALVLYWFQNHKTAYATEQGLRFSRVLDNLMENRTDMALVRIVIPSSKIGLDAATESASQFVSRLYPSLTKQFPVD